MTGLDVHTRALTEHERVWREVYDVELRLWRLYIEQVYTTDTLTAAITKGAPLELRRQRRGVDDYGEQHPAPVAVHVETAHRRMYGLDRMPVDVTAIPSVPSLIGALEFMGRTHGAVRPATTLAPRGEPEHFTRPYRRVGWWQLHGEAYRRLSFGHFVPVLSALHGRPSKGTAFVEQGAPPPRPRGRKVAARKVDVAVTTAVLRDYLATSEPTCLLAVARHDDRPLVPRRRGRMARLFENVGLPVSADTVIVSAAAVGRHAMAAAGRLDIPLVPPAWWSPERTAELLTMVARGVDGLEACSLFTGLDTPGRRSHGPGWFRVSLDWIGVAAPDRATLTAEWFDHELAIERRAAADAAARAADEAEQFTASFGEPIEETRIP